MANLRASKRDAKRSLVSRVRNNARRSEVKTYTKKVLEALDQKNFEAAKELFRAAESKIASASGKGVLKRNTAARKVSRLARKIAAATRGQ